MGYLLTFGVISFQLLISVTIVGAGAVGSIPLRAVTFCWFIFTLFGSIFTAGLLLLQLSTIAIAYVIGRWITNTDTPQLPPLKPKVVIQRRKNSPGFGIGIVIMLCVLAVWLSPMLFDRDDQSSSAQSGTPSSPIQNFSPPRAVATKPLHPHPVFPKKLSTADLRYCLSLKTNEAIIRCSEQPWQLTDQEE